MKGKTLNKNRNGKKGYRTSIILHGTFLLIAFLYSFSDIKEDRTVEKPHQVIVDFSFDQSSSSTYSQADKGTAKSPVIEKTQPSVTPEVKPTEEKIEIKETEVKEPVKINEAEVVQEESEVKVTKVEEVKEVESTETTAPETKKTPAEPTTPSPIKQDQDNSTKENSKLPTVLDGKGGGKGESGKGKGESSGDDDSSGLGNAEDGTGEYDGSGKGIFGRRVIKRNYEGIPMTESGIISIKTCIDQLGIVKNVEIIEDETTITDRRILKNTLKAAKGYLFEKDFKAPKEQCGILRIFLEIKE